jgi:hypothetical protein
MELVHDMIRYSWVDYTVQAHSRDVDTLSFAVWRVVRLCVVETASRVKR